MKKELAIPKDFLVLMLCIMAILVIMAVIDISKNYSKYTTVTSNLIRQEINGVIKSMKNENRGSYFLEIKTEKQLLNIHSLPVAWEVEKYNIQVGDSISKIADSRMINFYKSKNGVIEKICEFEL